MQGDAIAGRLAWGLAALALLLVVSGPVLAMATGTGFDVGRVVYIWAIALAFAATGVLIAANHPGTGSAGSSSEPRFLQASDCWPERTLSTGWTAGRGRRRSERRRRGTASSPGCLFILFPTTAYYLLFPDGRLSRPVGGRSPRCAGKGIAANFVAGGPHPGPIPAYPSIRNPLGVETSWLEGLEVIAALAVLGWGCSGSALSLSFLFRRAGGEQRQQINGLPSRELVAAHGDDRIAVYDVVLEGTWPTAHHVQASVLPAATGVAILRHRLSTEHRRRGISRTIVYAAGWAPRPSAAPISCRWVLRAGCARRCQIASCDACP